MNQTNHEKLSLICWHPRLDHLNFTSLRSHLTHQNITFIDDTEGYICDSYEKAKATKQYR